MVRNPSGLAFTLPSFGPARFSPAVCGESCPDGKISESKTSIALSNLSSKKSSPSSNSQTSPQTAAAVGGSVRSAERSSWAPSPAVALIHAEGDSGSGKRAVALLSDRKLRSNPTAPTHNSKSVHLKMAARNAGRRWVICSAGTVFQKQSFAMGNSGQLETANGTTSIHVKTLAWPL